MNQKGGYQIVDLGGNDISANPAGVTIEGLYEALEGGYDKTVLLTGLVLNGVEMRDCFAETTTEAGNFILSTPKGIYTITPDSLVTHSPWSNITVEKFDLPLAINVTDTITEAEKESFMKVFDSTADIILWKGYKIGDVVSGDNYTLVNRYNTANAKVLNFPQGKLVLMGTDIIWQANS